jgi:diguanylate cyclase (GGDEF)-like protein
METTDIALPFWLLDGLPAELDGTDVRRTPAPPPARDRRVGWQNRCILPGQPSYAAVMAVGESMGPLADEIRTSAWELALEVVDEGLTEDQIPSLARLGREGQLSDIPTFISELARELADPQPGRVRRGGQLAALVRDHARVREELGFAPREIVTEFLLLRRVLWRFVGRRTSSLDTGDVLVIERRLNDTIDRLVTECVVAYFDRATLELADEARRDPLTRLLNHHAFTDQLEAELDRAERYGRGLTLVFLDLDRFKTINDTFGHPEGDRVLREVARLLDDGLRGSDLAGRMGGDEFAVVLVESEPEAADRFLLRLREGIDSSDSPAGFSLSAGQAHYPSDGTSADDLFRLADQRLYEAKRA